MNTYSGKFNKYNYYYYKYYNNNNSYLLKIA